jgi:hypothetical protein
MLGGSEGSMEKVTPYVSSILILPTWAEVFLPSGSCFPSSWASL